MSEPALEARTGMDSQEEKAGRCAYEIRESQPELKTTLLNTVMNYLRGVNADQSAWDGDRRWRHEVSKQTYSSCGRFSCEQESQTSAPTISLCTAEKPLPIGSSGQITPGQHSSTGEVYCWGKERRVG